jgi:hypothetical protein
MIVGWTSLGVGIAGMLFHLQSHFFDEQTIHNLVYTTPFVAPLAYAGLGLLLILDRMVDSDSIEWAQWIVFLALGGFVGNFILSLADGHDVDRREGPCAIDGGGDGDDR